MHASTRLFSVIAGTVVVPGSLALTAPTADVGQDAACAAPDVFPEAGVRVAVQRSSDRGDVAAFVVPFPAGAVSDVRELAVTIGGEAVDATVAALVPDFDRLGDTVGVRAAQIQLPADALGTHCMVIDVSWTGDGGSVVAGDPIPYTENSRPVQETVETARYTIEDNGGAAELVVGDVETRVMFESREPFVPATFPDGYLIATGLFGHQVAATAVPAELAGLEFITDAVVPFGLSAMYQEAYPVNAESVIDPTDVDEEGYEGWLYDRCFTFLMLHAISGDARFRDEGYRTCAYYADHIELSGELRGIFTGKPDPDPKYSHVRGLYIYFALTGDEAARAAAIAIASRFASDEEFAGPYRAGRLPAPDALWTERLLAVSIENLYFGHLLAGDPGYLMAVEELVATAHRHITGDDDDLATLNPGVTQFPPQNCLVHSAEQAAEGDADDPWCSGWMPAMLVGPMLAYQDQTGDERVDEIFIRLTRYLRDIGTAYFTNTDDNAGDTFLDPAVPSPEPGTEDPRLLVPLYGAGLDADGQRVENGEFDDFQHCFDASAISAAGIRALVRSGGFDANPIGPFASEGESLLALHHELLACAAWTFDDQSRPHRDPATWDASALADGLGDPATFVTENKIGYVSHNVAPSRKISWWFNAGLEQFGLLAEAGIPIPTIVAGTIQPAIADSEAFPSRTVR
jgi:hypothetical protein